MRLRFRLSIIQGTRKGISINRARDFSELSDIREHLNVIFEYPRNGIVQSHIVFNELYATSRPKNEFSVIMISSRFGFFIDFLSFLVRKITVDKTQRR